jgi:hypothetical protein
MILKARRRNGSERRRVGDGVVHVQQEQASELRRFLLLLQLLLDERLLRQRLGLVLEALPDEAQQVQVRLLRRHAPQFEHGVEVRQARVVVQVLPARCLACSALACSPPIAASPTMGGSLSWQRTSP